MTQFDKEQKEVMKEAFKEAASEFLNDAAKTFGWWSIRTLGYGALVAVVFLILWANGWRHV